MAARQIAAVLPGKLQTAQRRIRGADIGHEQGVVEVVDERDARTGQQALEHRRPEQGSLPVKENGVVAPRSADLQRSTQAGGGHLDGLCRVPAGLVQQRMQALGLERGELQVDPERGTERGPLLDAVALPGRPVGHGRHDGKDTYPTLRRAHRAATGAASKSL